LPFPEADERVGESGDGRGGAQGSEAVGRGRPVEDPEQPEDGGLDETACGLEPALVGGDDAEGVAVLGLGVGLGEMKAVAPGDVGWVEGEAQVTPIRARVRAWPLTSTLARRTSASGPVTPCRFRTRAPASSVR
jgi:hypothetical protein